MTRSTNNARDTEASSRCAGDSPMEPGVQGLNRHTAKKALQGTTEASQERDDREATERGEDEGMTVAAEETAARSLDQQSHCLSIEPDQRNAKTPNVGSSAHNRGEHRDAIAER